MHPIASCFLLVFAIARLFGHQAVLFGLSFCLCLGLSAPFGTATAGSAGDIALEGAEVTASSSTSGYSPIGAMDGDRFATEPHRAWQGAAGQESWWWQAHFTPPRQVGAILQ